MKDIYLGFDISTTATKAIFIDSDGQIIAVTTSEYTYETPHPLWSEQDPNLWWNATVECLHKGINEKGINPQSIKGIGLTGQMHGLVILDNHGDVLRPSILWNDQRTQVQCDKIRELVGKEKFLSITGNDALTGFTAPKILWVMDNEPEIFKQIEHVLLPKDFIRYKLTGQFGVDCAGGSGTVLFDLKKRTWSKELIEILGLKTNWFPDTYEGTEVSGKVDKEAADILGIPIGVPVFGGGGDQAAAAVGTGAVEEGIVSLSLGTSGVVFAAVDSPFIEPEGRLHSFCHAVPNKWHLMGVMLSAAGSLRWFRDTFAENLDFNDIVSATDEIPPGSEGLLFMPYLTGERTPYPDPMARGGFVGVTIRHTLNHFTRAVLEGVAFGLRDSFELMKSIGLKEIREVRITGGGAKSPTWIQIISDVLGVDIVTVSSKEGAAFGAALLAASGNGAFQSIESACLKTIKVIDTIHTSKEHYKYEKFYSEYKELYPSLKKRFYKLAEIS